MEAFYIMKEFENDTLEKLIEKMDGESAVAYAAFLFYARLAPSERTANIAYPRIAQHCGKPESTIELWKDNYDWDDRAQTVSAFQFKLDFDEMREATRADREKYIEFNREIKKGMMDNLNKTVGVIATLIGYADLIGEEKKTGEIELADGRIVHQYTTVKMAAKVSDIAILANAVVKCAKVINEFPTEIIENKVVVDMNNLDKVPNDQLDEFSEKIAKRIDELKTGVIITDSVQ